MTFLFPFPSNHSHSNFRQQLYIDYLKAEKYAYCVLNSKQKVKLRQKHCQSNSPLISHHHYNFQYTYLCSLFNVISDCHCMLLCKNSRLFTLPVGILFFAYKICYFHSHSQFVALTTPIPTGIP